MISEKDMEDQIARAPDEFLGERGLSLAQRQARFGRYIFDLLFEDQHGGKLIVEIQKGTLDRNHTYKILDYYDEYKEQHPDQFVDVMVVANLIPAERKKRLNALGISHKEIPEDAFLSNLPTSDAVPPVVEQGAVLKGPVILDHNQRGEAFVVEIPADARVYWDDQSRRCYFGFAGRRACIAFLYARPEGATQREVNEVAAKLGTTQKNYLNMLRNSAKKWGHTIFTWQDKSRGGKVYKLIYNPDHRGPDNCDSPPHDWAEQNQIVAPPGVNVEEW